MTKAEIVKQIAGQTGLESKMVAGVVEALCWSGFVQPR